MRQRNEFAGIIFLFFFGHLSFSAPVLSVVSKPDSNSSVASQASSKKSSSEVDTALIIEDLTKKNHGAEIKPAEFKTTSPGEKDAAKSLQELSAVPPVRDSTQANTREMFRSLGNFHKAMGIYDISAGVLAILAGAAILEKEDILPFSLSLITLGGITVGIGVWDLSIGASLTK
jgi:hypothetical protein